MAVATATAFSGQVRTQRRAWTTSRGCWRLVVLLGLAWVALLLLGGTAHAAPADERRDEAAPAAPGPIPLLGQTLAKVGSTAGALPLEHVVQTLTGSGRTAVPEPVAETVAKTTQTLATATGTAATTASSAAAAAPAYLPVAQGADAAAGLADAVRATAEATASPDKLLDVKVPSIAASVTPVVDAVADQVDTTTHLVADAATVLTAPLPVARPLQAAVTPLVHTIDLATDVVRATGSFAAGAVDGVVATTTRALAPVLAVVSAPAGSIAVSGAGGPGSATGAASPPSPVVVATDAGAPRAYTASIPRQSDDRIPDGAHGRPTVPPPDLGSSSIDVVAQPASDIATVLPVPVSGAGSTTGNGGAAPTQALDQTLVRVESEPEVADDTTDPIEGPSGPMPGTPAADPAFSPD